MYWSFVIRCTYLVLGVLCPRESLCSLLQVVNRPDFSRVGMVLTYFVRNWVLLVVPRERPPTTIGGVYRLRRVPLVSTTYPQRLTRIRV